MRFVVIALFLTVFSLDTGSAKDELLPLQKDKIIAVTKTASPAAEARKGRSEVILKNENVPINRFLPPIIDQKQASMRSHEAVIRRALAVLCTAVKGEGLDQDTINTLIDDFGVRGDLSPKELAFIEEKNPATFDRVQFAWRYEAAWAMLWALSAVETLEPPRQIVDVRSIGVIVRGETVESLKAKTKLRPASEILDQADLIYRYRWALVDARANDREPPASLDPGVALERHRALNWLIGHLGQDWDEITTGT